LTKFEFRINTKVGVLVIHFDTPEEFENNLKSIDIESLVKASKDKLGNFMALETRQPKPGFENTYRFTPDGLVELLKVPEAKIDTIGLVLFAFDPSPATFNQVARSSGIQDPSVYLSKEMYQRYFTRTKEGYVLNQEGKAWILKDIVPKLKPQSLQN
jgi:hypothetical protein